MNDQFNEQKDFLTSLKHEISLLQQQVDYLIRNKKAIGLLDLDVMMNRTHTIYDQLCSINIGTPAADDEDIDIDPNVLSALFGSEELGVRSEEDKNENEEDLRSFIVVYPITSIIFLGFIGPMCEELTYRVGVFGVLKNQSLTQHSLPPMASMS